MANLRRVIFGVLHRSNVRRHLETAFSSLPGIRGERRPVIKSITRTDFGDRVKARLAKGTSVEDLAKMEPKLASSLGVRQVRSRSDKSRRNVVILSITRDDPFAEETPSPLLKVARTCFWDAINLGVNEEGDVISVPLVERNAMLGGEPGSGKSVSLNQLVASAALDPDTDLWLFDGNGVDLAIWRNCAKAFVGYSLCPAMRLKTLRMKCPKERVSVTSATLGSMKVRKAASRTTNWIKSPANPHGESAQNSNPRANKSSSRASRRKQDQDSTLEAVTTRVASRLGLGLPVILDFRRFLWVRMNNSADTSVLVSATLF